ncbi:MAG: hypothetical protein ACT4P6_20750, partial [Gemmatimonadaceae bacterium]
GGGNGAMMGGGRGGGGGGGGAGATRQNTTARESRGEVVLATQQQGQQMPEVTDEQCAKVRDAFAKQPEAQGKLQGLFQRMRAGEVDMQQMRAATDSIYKSLGVESRVARACQMRDRGGQGGPGRGATTGSAAERGAQTATAPNAQRMGAAQSQRSEGGQRSTPVPAGEFSSMRTRARPALVFVADSTGFKPRVVRVGSANLDYTEIVSGLKEGERVALLAVAQAAAAREQANDRMRSMTQGSGGMPGMAPGGAGGQPRR